MRPARLRKICDITKKIVTSPRKKIVTSPENYGAVAPSTYNSKRKIVGGGTRRNRVSGCSDRCFLV